MDARPWLLVPLDDRPCCADFPQQLGGDPLLLPPRPLLGRFQTPGQCDAILDWLEDQAPRAAGAIVALDMIAWGGLVASRLPDKDPQAALARLQRLLKIPNLKILAFQTIMRNAPTQRTPQEVQWAEAITRLSQATAQGDEEACGRLRSQIPADLLADYLEARACNAQIYHFLAKNSQRFDYLVFALDDSKTAGWNLLELGQLGAVENLPGTDETALLLLARARAEVRQIQLSFSHPELASLQGLYEDRPLGQVLEAQMRAANLQAVESSPRQLWLYGRPGALQEEARQQQAHCVDPVWLESLGSALDRGNQVVLVDLTFANGGDLSLGQALADHGLWSRLRGYAAWNTLGNRLGTALANLVLPLSPQRSREFLSDRVMDDLLYQADFRWRAAAMLGHSGLTLEDSELERVQTEVFPGLLRAARQLGPEFELTPRLELPWGRLFELAIRPRDA